MYLKEGNKYDDLKDILQKWCASSGAHFNTEKTEILPVGTQEHRENVTDMRQLSPNEQQISNTVRIIKDGEHTRVLGAYVGNGVKNITVWTPLVEAIDKHLN